MSDRDSGERGEVLPPRSEDESGDAKNILTLIHSYTDRPDLLLSEIEKHNPGFTKDVCRSAIRHEEQLREGRFRFGKYQAYVSLVVSVLAAASLLAFFGYALINGQLSFLGIIGIALFYAITQGGSHGFNQLVDAFADLISKFRKNRSP